MSAGVTAPGALLAAAMLIRGYAYIGEWSPTIGTLWIATAIVCLVQLRVGACAAAVLALWAITGDHYYNHVTFMFWVALTLAMFGDVAQQRFVLRCQLSIVFGFAALAKVNADWLAGDILRVHEARLPDALVTPAAGATVLAEAAIAALLWFPAARWTAIAIAAPLNLGFWLLMGTNVFWSPGLLPFNILAFGMLVWATADHSWNLRRSRS